MMTGLCPHPECTETKSVYFPDVVTLSREKKSETFWELQTTFFNLLALKQAEGKGILMVLLPNSTNEKVKREDKLFVVNLTIIQKPHPSSHENCSLTIMQTWMCMQSPEMKNLGIFYIKAMIKDNSNQLISAMSRRGNVSKAKQTNK